MSVSGYMRLRQRIEEARGSEKRLRRLVAKCENRQAQAELIGWPALAASFAQDIARAQTLLAEIAAPARGAQISQGPSLALPRVTP